MPIGVGPVQMQLPLIQIQTHAGPLPPPAQLQEYEAAFPGAARWIFDQAAKNAEHTRTMEQRAIAFQQRDALLHRLLPFAVVVAFLVACVIIAFASPLAGGVGLAATMAGVLYAYLTDRAPPQDKPTDER